MGIFSRKKKNTEPVPLGAITAAGTSYSAASYPQTAYLTLLKQQWQPAVFDIYDTEGHLYYATAYIGNALSRINLVAARKPEKDAPLARPVIIEDGPLADAVNRIESPNGGQSGLLKKIGQNIFLVGEVWMIPRDYTNAAGDTVQGWEALSTAELMFNGTGSPYKVSLPGAPIELLPPDILKIRIWKQHPRYSAWADAGPRSCLDQLELIVTLNRAEKAVARSRMAGSGILGIPQELVPPAWQNQGTSGNPMEANPLYQQLAEAAIAPLLDEAAPSSVMPTLLVGPGDHIKNIKHIEINRTLDFQQTNAAIDNAIDQIATTLELPKEILLGIGGETTHWCVTEDTEILTSNGWKTYKNLDIGDLALTLNHESGLSEWNPVQNIATFEVENEEMVKLETKTHSSISTSNHRWPVLSKSTGGKFIRKWTTSDSIHTGHRIIASASFDKLPTTPRYSNEFVELIAWTWTEGSIRSRPGRNVPQISIHQSHDANPAYIKRIENVLTTLYGPDYIDALPSSRRGKSDEIARWRRVDRGNGMSVFRVNNEIAKEICKVCPNRHTTLEFIQSLTLEQLSLFIDVSLMADNCGNNIIGQKDPTMLDAIELAAILSGRKVCRFERIVDGFTLHKVYQLSIGEKTVCDFQHGGISKINYTGTIWCPVTANQTWFARHNGKSFYTGNTAWAVREDTFQGHVQPLVELVCEALTRTYLKQALSKLDPTTLDQVLAEAGAKSVDDIIVWYDASQLIIRPDKGDKALAVHDRLAISDQALRRETGFSEDDAPDKNEQAKRIGLKMVLPDMAVTGDLPEPVDIAQPAQALQPAGGSPKQ